MSGWLCEGVGGPEEGVEVEDEVVEGGRLLGVHFLAPLSSWMSGRLVRIFWSHRSPRYFLFFSTVQPGGQERPRSSEVMM